MNNIEDILKRYFEADTTVGEERLLREFFAGESVPSHLIKYKALLSEESLDDSFDDRILTSISEDEPQIVTAHRITFGERVAPLFKVAASVAIVLCIGMAADQGMRVADNPTIVSPDDIYNINTEMSALETAVCDSVQNSELNNHFNK